MFKNRYYEENVNGLMSVYTNEGRYQVLSSKCLKEESSYGIYCECDKFEFILSKTNKILTVYRKDLKRIMSDEVSYKSELDINMMTKKDPFIWGDRDHIARNRKDPLEPPIFKSEEDILL